MIARAICKSLLWMQDASRLELHGFVVMPDHVHIVMTPKASHQLRQIMHSVKSFTSQCVNSELGRRGSLWQSSYHEQGLRSQKAMQAAIEYVHLNPVTAGLVEQPDEWLYSSAHEAYANVMDPW